MACSLGLKDYGGGDYTLKFQIRKHCVYCKDNALFFKTNLTKYWVDFNKKAGTYCYAYLLQPTNLLHTYGCYQY